jgi:hypothetical protein
MRRCVCLVMVVYAAIAGSLHAQEPTGSIGGGGGVSGVGLVDQRGHPTTSPGVTAWLDLHVRNDISLEGKVSWYPRLEFPEYETQGGRTLAVTGGMRGTLIETPRVRVQGLMSLGLLRFSGTAMSRGDNLTTIGGRTHFSVGLGGGLEVCSDCRWAPRVDILHMLYIVPGARVFSSPETGGPFASASIYGRVADTYQLTAGVRYRPARQKVDGLSTPQRRSTIGVQFTYAGTAGIGSLAPWHNIGVGGFSSFRLTDHIHLDGSVSSIAGPSGVRNPWEGGRVTQALLGVKAGVTRGRLGLFVKTRAGVNSHGAAFKGRDLGELAPLLGRSNIPAVDLGGVVEFAPRAWIIARVEVSSVTSIYGRRTIRLDGAPVPQGGQSARQGIQLTVGSGWAF